MLRSYLSYQKKFICLFLGFLALLCAVFFLYQLPLEPVLYAFFLCVVSGAVLLCLGFFRYWQKQRILRGMRQCIETASFALPPPADALEEAYQALLNDVCAHHTRIVADSENRYRDIIDYFTLWAHQIKTPIAAMELLLQGDDSRRGRELRAELFKTEQYVEMVLSYLRLGSEQTDFLFRRIALDDTVRAAVRKYAKLFILRKISLDFQETGMTVLTDEKWLSFVIEQILSNALKYTPEGGRIRILKDGPCLVIADSGIGIRSEDLPRVFEKGFTGYNGREDKKSTGIGLYLCKQVTGKLNHGLSITSQPGLGTRVYLHFDGTPSVVE